MKPKVSRRKFLKSSAAAGLAAAAAPTILSAANPNEKLNIAAIGVGGRGWGDVRGVSSENIVALCDVNARNLARAAKEYPKAKQYVDWRKCLEQKDIDAVVCATTDHTHAFINVWAMNRGKHVYCEKPLANSVEEARMVRQTYLKHKGKIATQQGTQIHASENFRRVVELIRDGAIGTPKDVHVWCSRAPKGGDYLPAAGPVPSYLNWDLWIGPSPMHEYNPGYVGGCLKWNRFWDFGTGQIGDMGSHMNDLAYWGLDLGIPTSVQTDGSPHSDATCPTWIKSVWDHPANNWRPAVKAYWYDGGKKPGMPMSIISRDDAFKGVLFRGDKGWLLADYGWLIYRPNDGMAHFEPRRADKRIPPSLGHHKEWIHACKTGEPTLCNFDYAGALIEQNMLSMVSYRLGKAAKSAAVKARKGVAARPAEEYVTGPKLTWDSENLKAVGCDAAEKFIKKTYRDGWALNG